MKNRTSLTQRAMKRNRPTSLSGTGLLRAKPAAAKKARRSAGAFPGSSFQLGKGPAGKRTYLGKGNHSSPPKMEFGKLVISPRAKRQLSRRRRSG